MDIQGMRHWDKQLTTIKRGIIIIIITQTGLSNTKVDVFLVGH